MDLSITMVYKYFNKYIIFEKVKYRKREIIFPDFITMRLNGQRAMCSNLNIALCKKKKKKEKSRLNQFSGTYLMFRYRHQTREHLCIPNPLIRESNVLYFFNGCMIIYREGKKKKYNRSYEIQYAVKYKVHHQLI